MAHPTKLAEYLAKEQISQAEFARRVSIRREVLWHYIVGDRKPGLDNALAIAEATGGAVPAEYWTGFTPKPRPRRDRRLRLTRQPA